MGIYGLWRESYHCQFVFLYMFHWAYSDDYASAIGFLDPQFDHSGSLFVVSDRKW